MFFKHKTLIIETIKNTKIKKINSIPFKIYNFRLPKVYFDTMK